MSTTCPTCGADVPEGFAQCQVCGADVASTPGADATPDAGSAVDPTPPETGESAGSIPPPPGSVPPPPPGGGSYGGGTYGGSGYGGSTAPALPSEVRNWGMAAHLSAFLGAWAALAFVGPLVVWLLKREEHPFIEHHAKEALNFNLSVLLYGAVGLVLAFLLVGIPLLIALGIAWVVFTIIAAVKASNGEGYRYPMTIRFIS